MSSVVYTNKPLESPGDHVRVLNLAPGEPTDPISCTIDVLSRAAKHEYIAISYTWGDTTPTETIWVDGYPLEVRYNCWLVLWQMRWHNIKLPLWIDSICIDQQNTAEKNEQVRHMGSIYARASWTAACLGDGPELATVIEDIETFADSGYETWLIPPAQRHLPAAQSADVARRWGNLFSFAGLPYFTRLWIVQELYHSRDVVAFCGKSYLQWDELEKYFLAIAEEASSLENEIEALPEGYVSLDETTLARFVHFRRFRAAQSRFVASHQTDDISGRGFTGILLSFGEGECLDPRDKVYGLLSLARETRWLRDFPIDYGRPLHTVLLDVVSRLGEEALAENVSRLIVCLLRWFGIDRSETASFVEVLRAIEDRVASGDMPATMYSDHVVPFHTKRVWRVVRAGLHTAAVLPHIQDCCMFFYADSTQQASYMVSPFTWAQVCWFGGKLVKSNAETFWVVGRGVRPGDFIVLFDSMRDESDELNTCLVCRPVEAEKHRLDVVEHATCLADLKVFDKIYHTRYAQSIGPERLHGTMRQYLRSNMLAAWQHEVQFTVYLKSVDILKLVMLRGLPVGHLRHPIRTETSGCFATRDVIDPTATGSRSLTVVQDEAGNLRLNESGWTYDGPADSHVPLPR